MPALITGYSIPSMSHKLVLSTLLPIGFPFHPQGRFNTCFLLKDFHYTIALWESRKRSKEYLLNGTPPRGLVAGSTFPAGVE